MVHFSFEADVSGMNLYIEKRQDGFTRTIDENQLFTTAYAKDTKNESFMEI